MATVDVVVPCYQYGRYLPECIGSIVSQGGVELRALIIDNASTDDSAEVAARLASSDPRVSVIKHKQNEGAVYSYNEGIDWAEADYFLILDADDALAPGALSRATAILEMAPEVSFTCGVELQLSAELGGLRLSGYAPAYGWRITPGSSFIERMCRRPVNTVGANTVVRRTAMQKVVGYYNSSLPYTDDLEMWLRLASVGSVAATDAVQAIRRMHGARMSTGYDGVGARDFAEREAAFACFLMGSSLNESDVGRLLASVRTGLGKHAYWSAVSHFCRGKRSVANELLRFSLERYPIGAVCPPLDWILKMDRPFSRTAEIVGESLSRLLQNVKKPI